VKQTCVDLEERPANLPALTRHRWTLPSRGLVASLVTTHKRAPYLAMCVLLGLAACVRPCTYPLVQRSGQTEKEAELIQRMRVAECIDQMTSASWTKNPTLDQYYAEKADDVRSLRLRLERGETPSQEEISRAFDTSKALQWSGFSY
jgi:hypothetical protein